MICPTVKNRPQTLEGAAAWERGLAAIRGGGMAGAVYIDRGEAARAADPRVIVDEAAVNLLLTAMEAGLREGMAEKIAAIENRSPNHNGSKAIN